MSLYDVLGKLELNELVTIIDDNTGRTIMYKENSYKLYMAGKIGNGRDEWSLRDLNVQLIKCIDNILTIFVVL